MDEASRKRLMQDYQKQVGQRIKNARGKKHSQQSLGELVGLTRTSINNIEHGRQRIMVDTLFLISTILDVPIVTLLPSDKISTKEIGSTIPSHLSDSVKVWIEGVFKE